MKFLLNTEIGLMGIWDIQSLDLIVDKASYMANLVNDSDITNLINKNGVVIWGVGGDGTRLLDFRVGGVLSDDEMKHVEIESSEYKLTVSSGEVIVGSPEWAGKVQEDGFVDANGIKSFKLENGDYKVKIFFLYWDDENDDSDNPEFVVCINKTAQGETFSPLVEFETIA